MNTKRQVLSGERNTPITDGMLALLAELDSAPVSRRRSQEFKDKSRELAQILNLFDEYWTINSVLDTSAEPCHPRGYVAREDCSNAAR
jgi:hypothetical protein